MQGEIGAKADRSLLQVQHPFTGTEQIAGRKPNPTGECTEHTNTSIQISVELEKPLENGVESLKLSLVTQSTSRKAEVGVLKTEIKFVKENLVVSNDRFRVPDGQRIAQLDRSTTELLALEREKTLRAAQLEHQVEMETLVAQQLQIMETLVKAVRQEGELNFNLENKLAVKTQPWYSSFFAKAPQQGIQLDQTTEPDTTRQNINNELSPNESALRTFR